MPAPRWIFWVLLLAVPLATSISEARVTIQGFDDRHSATNTRLVFETDAKLLYDYDHQKLGVNHKLVLRMLDAKSAVRIPSRVSNDRFVKELARKTVKLPGGDEELQLSIALAPKTEVKISALPPSGTAKHRLIVDLKTTKSDTRDRRAGEDISASEDEVVVVIDAGHGGEDPGAIAHGLLEKDITLAISNFIVDELAKVDGIRGLPIRSEDTTVSLGKRVRLAHALGADFFVSIHADAYINPDASGVSVYAHGTPDETSSDGVAWLVGRANIDDSDLLDSESSNVVASMTALANISASLEYGKSILESLESTTSLHSDRVEQGDFTVLAANNIPSILIETGFITNPNEAQLLGERSHQRKLGKKIAHALVAYVRRRPHTNTWMGEHVASNTYTVAIGDTLNKVAKEFGLSPSLLANYNDIRNEDDLKAGDILRIPQ